MNEKIIVFRDVFQIDDPDQQPRAGVIVGK